MMNILIIALAFVVGMVVGVLAMAFTLSGAVKEIAPIIKELQQDVACIADEIDE